MNSRDNVNKIVQLSTPDDIGICSENREQAEEQLER